MEAIIEYNFTKDMKVWVQGGGSYTISGNTTDDNIERLAEIVATENIDTIFTRSPVFKGFEEQLNVMLKGRYGYEPDQYVVIENY